MLLLSVFILVMIIYTIINIPTVYAEFIRYKNDSNILFIHIPKTGGNSFIDTFENIMYINHHESLKHNYMNLENKYKITIVRNPYRRCVSAYNYLKNGGMVIADIYYQFLIKEYDNFKDFVKDLVILANNKKVLHLIPQYKFIEKDGKILVDKIMKLENIDNELNDFCLENNLECPKKLQKKNKSKHKDYREYYDKETQDLVYNFYKKDFDLLGYSYEL